MNRIYDKPKGKEGNSNFNYYRLSCIRRFDFNAYCSLSLEQITPEIESVRGGAYTSFI